MSEKEEEKVPLLASLFRLALSLSPSSSSLSHSTMPPRASSVASATYADPQLGLESPDLAQQDSDDEGGGAGGGGGGAGDGEGEGELDEEDDPLVQQELEAFGSGAVEETLPAPPADPNLKILQQQQAAAELQAGGGAAGAAGSAGAGGKRTLAAGGGPLARAKRPKSVKHRCVEFFPLLPLLLFPALFSF